MNQFVASNHTQIFYFSKYSICPSLYQHKQQQQQQQNPQHIIQSIPLLQKKNIRKGLKIAEMNSDKNNCDSFYEHLKI